MKFQYIPTSGVPVTVDTTLRDLATYIATDWMPGVPTQLANDFAGVLGSVLEPQDLDKTDFLCVNPILNLSDRQWKGTTSWILGVAFARLIIEREGYPWWSPVSAFSGPSSTGKTSTGEWPAGLPRSDFHIERKKSATSNLLPDYVAVKSVEQSRSEYAFVESKGTDRALQGTMSCLSTWREQVQSAAIYLAEEPIAVSRHLIIATRVNPQAVSPKKRKIIVRAWNSQDNRYGTDQLAFAHFLAIHYAGLCWRLGLTDLAELMQAAADRMMEHPESGASRTEDAESQADEEEDPFDKGVHSSLSLSRLDIKNGPQIYLSQTPLIVGDRRYRIGFLDSAIALMSVIAQNDVAAINGLAHGMSADVQKLRDDAAKSHSDYFTALTNGVVVV